MHTFIPIVSSLHNNTQPTALALLLLRLFMLHLLLRPPLLHMMLRPRIPSTRSIGIRVFRRLAHRISRLIHRPAVLLMRRLVMLPVVVSGHLSASTAGLQVDVDPALVLLCIVLQAQLAAYLLHAWFELLHVVGAVVAFAHNHMQMSLARGLGVSYPLLQDLLRLFHELSMQIDGVAGHLANSIVLPEDVLRSLLVVIVGFRFMLLALLAELMRAGSIALLVCFARFGRIVLVLALLFAGEVAEAIVLALGIRRGTVVESWKDSVSELSDVA